MKEHTSMLKAANDERAGTFRAKQPIDLLFIHHSCGGQLLASAGPESGADAIYTTHPNGGGLRAKLESHGFAVHEASYGSKIGQDTDVFDWLPKFRKQMAYILICNHQDSLYSDGRRNRVVIFKSCFPNNEFEGLGKPPGSPSGPLLTVWNAKASYAALLDEFAKRPDTLFVCVTAPPLARMAHPEPAWKRLLKRALGRDRKFVESGQLAREFNEWLAGKEGWLKDYKTGNVAVFDYFGIVTCQDPSGFSKYPTGNGCDSHPSREGNEKAADEFVEFLTRALAQGEAIY